MAFFLVFVRMAVGGILVTLLKYCRFPLPAVTNLSLLSLHLLPLTFSTVLPYPSSVLQAALKGLILLGAVLTH
jgi:hypothetical protein